MTSELAIKHAFVTERDPDSLIENGFDFGTTVFMWGRLLVIFSPRDTNKLERQIIVCDMRWINR